MESYSEPLSSIGEQPRSENTPLLSQGTQVVRYGTTRTCVTSKSALLILFWSFLVGLWNGVALSPDFYLQNFLTLFPYTLIIYGCIALLMLFFPLAGFLADIRCGRYKMVVRSLFFLWLALPVGAVASIVMWSLSSVFDLSKAYSLVLAISLTLLTSVLSIGALGFNANVIQFGMDQLHDSPGEDRSLFIHWYVWLSYLSIFLGQLAWNLAYQIPYNMLQNAYYSFVGYSLLGAIPLVVAVGLPATLCLARHRKKWFLVEPGGMNPYKLVYNVTKFARQHKAPINRSAFTYCEDEVPTGLDLAKNKYGGPFTTEEVEDVKVFYGILKILFSFGTVFFLDFAASSVQPLYSLHTAPYYIYMDWNHHYKNFISNFLMVLSLSTSYLTMVFFHPCWLYYAFHYIFAVFATLCLHCFQEY